jgi:4-amino-4-deoxy-L-arabinose transferase-like glycosyltransferase
MRAILRSPISVPLAILAWLAATAGLRPLMLPDEGRYVGVAWEMLRSGNWLTPTLNGLPFFHKPPLFYWITAGAMELLGKNELAMRMAPILGAALGAYALYLFTARWVSLRVARTALLILLVQPFYYVGGQFANLDMLVAGCITATITLFAHAVLARRHALPWRAALAGAYAFAALGVLAKGLIGAVIPAMVVLVWLRVASPRRSLRLLFWFPGWALLGLIALPWFVAMQLRYPGFFDYFIVVQHFRRFATGGFNNVQPFWFYPAVLALLMLPWLPWLGRPAAASVARDTDRGAVGWLLCLWAGLVVFFFSIPGSKLLGYVLPAMPPLACLVALAVHDRRHWIGRRRGSWKASFGVSLVASVGTVIAVALVPRPDTQELGAALEAMRGANEPVFMLGEYRYDLPLAARLDGPVGVVDDWSDPAIASRDNWRREMADAAAFAPQRAARVLIEPSSLGRTLCESGISWVIGSAPDATRYPFLGAATLKVTAGEVTLWRLDAAQAASATQLQCRPNELGSPVALDRRRATAKAPSLSRVGVARAD